VTEQRVSLGAVVGKASPNQASYLWVIIRDRSRRESSSQDTEYGQPGSVLLAESSLFSTFRFFWLMPIYTRAERQSTPRALLAPAKSTVSRTVHHNFH